MMDKAYDFPVYRSDANDPEEKESKNVRGPANPHEKLIPGQPAAKTEYVARKESSMKLKAEQKFAQASERRQKNDKTLDPNLMGQIVDPRHEIS